MDVFVPAAFARPTPVYNEEFYDRLVVIYTYMILFVYINVNNDKCKSFKLWTLEADASK
jgi:hypothetical protein